MKEQDVKESMARISKYRALETLRDEISLALKKVTEPWAEGPSGQGPFTGNTRESRKVRSMIIRFTETLGGAAGVELEIPKMHIEAWELGQALEAMLREKLNAVNDAMEKL